MYSKTAGFSHLETSYNTRTVGFRTGRKLIWALNMYGFQETICNTLLWRGERVFPLLTFRDFSDRNISLLPFAMHLLFPIWTDPSIR